MKVTAQANFKLHTYCMRFAYNQKEVFLLCASPEEAKEIYDKLMPPMAPAFETKKGGWAYADLDPAPAPRE